MSLEKDNDLDLFVAMVQSKEFIDSMRYGMFLTVATDLVRDDPEINAERLRYEFRDAKFSVEKLRDFLDSQEDLFEEWKSGGRVFDHPDSEIIFRKSVGLLREAYGLEREQNV